MHRHLIATSEKRIVAEVSKIGRAMPEQPESGHDQIGRSGPSAGFRPARFVQDAWDVRLRLAASESRDLGFSRRREAL